MTSIRLHLDPDAFAELESIRDAGGKSAARDYVSAIIRLRARLWRQALADLQIAGWSGAEILCACDALHGTWSLGFPPAYLALELRNAARLAGVASKWGVADRWTERVCQVGEDPVIARALTAVVAEVWSHNEALAARLRSKDDERRPPSP